MQRALAAGSTELLILRAGCAPRHAPAIAGVAVMLEEFHQIGPTIGSQGMKFPIGDGAAHALIVPVAQQLVSKTSLVELKWQRSLAIQCATFFLQHTANDLDLHLRFCEDISGTRRAAQLSQLRVLCAGYAIHDRREIGLRGQR